MWMTNARKFVKVDRKAICALVNQFHWIFKCYIDSEAALSIFVNTNCLSCLSCVSCLSCLSCLSCPSFILFISIAVFNAGSYQVLIDLLPVRNDVLWVMTYYGLWRIMGYDVLWVMTYYGLWCHGYDVCSFFSLYITKLLILIL